MATPSLIHTIPGSDWVQGLTLLGDSLFAVKYREQHITEYNSTTVRHVRNINLPDMSTGGVFKDITSCVTNQCLYVGDYTARTIHRVQLPAASLTKWTMKDRPIKLSVSDNCTVIVTCQEQNKICEFSTQGALLRDVVLQAEIGYPQHTILLSTGQFLLCHESSQHRVSLFSSDGHIVKSYGGAGGSSPGQLNNPAHMSVYQGLVLVADCCNNKIQLLSSDLTHIRDIITNTSHGLSERPYSLCMDEMTGRLFIGSARGPIQVYQILNTK